MNINPFYYGGAVKDSHFCNRVDKIKNIYYLQDPLFEYWFNKKQT